MPHRPTKTTSDKRRPCLHQMRHFQYFHVSTQNHNFSHFVCQNCLVQTAGSTVPWKPGPTSPLHCACGLALTLCDLRSNVTQGFQYLVVPLFHFHWCMHLLHLLHLVLANAARPAAQTAEPGSPTNSAPTSFPTRTPAHHRSRKATPSPSPIVNATRIDHIHDSWFSRIWFSHCQRMSLFFRSPGPSQWLRSSKDMGKNMQATTKIVHGKTVLTVYPTETS